MSLLGRVWRRLKQAYVFVLPLRFNLFAIFILIFAFCFSDQGQDILRALGEERDRRALDIALFILMSNALAWQIWYWSRHLLRYRPQVDPDDPHRDPIRDPLPSDPHLLGLAKWLPRLLGLLVFVVEIRGVVDVNGWINGIVGFLLLSAAIYLGFVITRRDLAAKLNRPLKDERFTHAGLWSDYNSVAQALLVIAILVEAACFFWAYFNPVSWNVLGVAATLVLTIAVWIPLGTLIIAIAERLRFPFGMALCIWALLISPFADNHVIRTSGSFDPGKRVTIDEAFESWYRRVQPAHGNAPVPVIIVATEGGGIRAAYWTAAALTSVTDSIPAFADHCFAISGVSGGSLGALVYDAILARRMDHPDLSPRAPEVRRILGYDALSGTLAALAQPDLIQRIIPFPYLRDRERALEEGWEASWDNAPFDDHLFAKPMLSTMSAHPRLPNLFLNGTVVESGERIITSNVQLHPKIDPILAFRNAFDAFDEMRKDIPFSCAAGMSARFTYVSPAGKIPFTRSHQAGTAPCSARLEADVDCDRELFGHVVDGGYFENSGAVTAAEIVSVVRDYAALHNYSIQPVVVVIDHWNHMVCENCPTSTPPRLFCPAEYQDGPKIPAKVERFANEVLSPLRGVLNARDARGKEAIGDLAQAKETPMIELRLAPPTDNATPLPLGWILSDAAMTQIDNAMTQQNGNRAAVAALARLIVGGQASASDCAAKRCGQGIVDQKGSAYGN